jgi:hypothetical protein
MEILAPRPKSEEISRLWNERLGVLSTVRPLLPFDAQTISFIENVSARILMDRAVRRWPELLVVAHWMRGAHLRELHETFPAENEVRLARGLVIHYAPANVDSIFLYSWFISLLSGNSNVVRVSQRRGEQLDYLISHLNAALDLPEFENIRRRNLLVSFAHDDAMNTEISSHCAVRVIWGGDRTVAAIRRIPLPARATELAFADRFSLALICAAAISASDDESLLRLAKKFYNDAFSFDQLACSSPRLIVWTGSHPEIVHAKKRFWAEVIAICGQQKQYPEIVTMNRVTAAYAYAAVAQADSIASTSISEFPLRLHLKDGATEYRDLHCGGGLFLEKDLPDLSTLPELLSSKDQTLSYFGYEPSELKAFTSQLPGCAIDRIVPLGQSLDFSATWDGIDLFRAFTRCVDVR